MAEPWLPHAKQAELLKAFLVDDNKRGVALFGRQTGKTMSAVELAKLAAIMHQGTYFMVFRTYNQAEQVVWKQYLHLIEKELINGKPNADSLTITFKHIHGPMAIPGVGWVRIDHDNDLPPSRIRLLGSDQAESHRGNKANGIIFDEYQGQNPDNWTSVYQPMFNTTDGWALFMGTPNGFNHFYDLVQEAKSNQSTYFYSEATWRDNPYVKKEAVDEARRDAQRKGNLNGFLQEYELEFRKVDRAVYTEFDRNTHVIPPSEVPEGGQIWASIDFGYVEDHPTAVNFVKIMDDGTWYIYDEMHITETPLDSIIEQIKQRTSGIHLQGIVADSARPDLIDVMGSKALPVIPAPKKPGSVQTAITLMRQQLHPRLQLIGEPKPMMYVTSNCKHTILNFELRAFKEPIKERAVSDVPLKENDDHTDGLGYLLTHLKLGLQKDSGKWGNTKIKFDGYGMPLSL
jgi:hypothetical protein